ncbi:MAG: hypothetical protein JO257_30825 [Deltaproteobacteria bacterium]|nr:hypothetical protein [Deltaproteobacteria bacterium]
MPGPRRSEDEPVLSGESAGDRSDDRRVEAGRIIVTPMPRAQTANPIPGLPVRGPLPAAPERRTGAWLVVIVYVLSVAALGYALWERFLR